MAQPVIHFDYDFSPYGQKTKLLLTATQTPFQKSDQPLVLPRPDLEALGITYRRIPLLAIGKDVYCDSALILRKIQSDLAVKPLKRSPADDAYGVWGDEVFAGALGIIPSAMLTEGFVKDREAIFPFLTRSDLGTLRPSAVAQFRARLRQVEEEFLGGSNQGPFIGGEEISVADVHVVWPLRWVFNSLGVGEKEGCGKDAFPKVWRLIESLPEAKPEVLSAEIVKERILGSGYSAKELDVAPGDPYGIQKGTAVTVESFDSTPGSYPQAGKLVGTTTDEVVLEIKNGIRLHFPRIGYIVRPQ